MPNNNCIKVWLDDKGYVIAVEYKDMKAADVLDILQDAIAILNKRAIREATAEYMNTPEDVQRVLAIMRKQKDPSSN